MLSGKAPLRQVPSIGAVLEKGVEVNVVGQPRVEAECVGVSHRRYRELAAAFDVLQSVHLSMPMSNAAPNRPI
jgi:hypothetical protein